MVRAAGMEPVERDSHYNIVMRSPATDNVKPAEVESEPVITEVEVEEEQDIVVVEQDVEVEEVVSDDHKQINVNEEKEEKIMTEDKDTAKVVDVDDKVVKEEKSRKRSKDKKSGDAKPNRIVTFYKRFPVISHIIFIGIFGLLLLVLLFFGLKWSTRHDKLIVVPDFVGMTIEEARGVANNKDLNIVVRDSIFDVDLPGGTIVDQLPGTSDVRDVTVKPGRKIYVTINAFNRRQVYVPYVAKQTLRQALNQLERSGLTIEKLVYEPDMTSTDYVERQTVSGKEVGSSSKRQVPVGTGVTLYVTYHRNEQYTVAPRVVGMSLAKAKASLWDHGLNVGKIVYDESVGDIIDRRTARVYKQSAAIGSSQRRGAKVDIYLSVDDVMVDSLRLIADKEADRAEALRRKQQQAKQREADSLAALDMNN